MSFNRFIQRAANFLLFVFLFLAAAESTFAATFLKWRQGDLSGSSLESVLSAINEKTGYHLKQTDFILDEERPLAFNSYKRYSQLISGVRVKDASIRIWANSTLVQAEANIEDPSAGSSNMRMFSSRHRSTNKGLKDFSASLSVSDSQILAKSAIAGADDKLVRNFRSEDYLIGSKLVREMQLFAKYGKHIVKIDLMTKKVIEAKYLPYPTNEALYSSALKAKVFPVYEEYSGQILERQEVSLRNLNQWVKRTGTKDPFEELRTSQRYLYSMYDPLKALSTEGQYQGYWSDKLLRDRINAAVSKIPSTRNSFNNGGLLLQGKFATININPEALRVFPNVGFTPEFSTHPYWQYKDVVVDGVDDTEVITSATYLNKPFADRSAIFNAPATRYPEHNPALYINEGFDQIQVYYAIDKLFEILHGNGWSDPELSTRPFHANLYDPDISMRDNAFYTSDTINFTTYSKENMARDNTTIWHELGHGVMDRLMGDMLHLADTGGLSEGMADFVAALVLQGAIGNKDFAGKQDQRIINKTGFFLTNEVHDDGESYGGVMKDILDKALDTWGNRGLKMMTDLTFETMRLTRDHPALNAAEWFDHMIFADSLGRPELRNPGEMAGLIQAALNSRNFFEDAKDRGKLSLKYSDSEVVAGSPGSRGYGIKTPLAPNETKDLEIKIKVEDGAKYAFNYPLTTRVYFRTGPLQGAIHWDGEENTYKDFVVESSGAEITLPLKVSGTCDFVNREDGSCVDFVYVQILQNGDTKALAKKRFYVQVKPKAAAN